MITGDADISIRLNEFFRSRFSKTVSPSVETLVLNTSVPNKNCFISMYSSNQGNIVSRHVPSFGKNPTMAILPLSQVSVYNI